MTRRSQRFAGYAVGIMLAVLALLSTCTPQPVHAAERGLQPVRIPTVSTLYRLRLEREAARNFGLDAPVARLAAQIHQESGWRSDAASPYANGMAQFTPATAKWLPSVCPAVGVADPWDPDWSLRAIACYDAWLHARVTQLPGSTLSACSRWAYTLRAYNGGEGWLMKERRKAAAAGVDGNAWRAVEPYRVRAGWAHTENTDYPRRILLRLEPAYRAAGWPGSAAC
ncbi:transglycosylase SLT domain-containing protein [Pseudoxanthomonas sp. UTMC 1351]|uniref:transglycosylase SLT domain-containing protein n=1 Tax=Pseudoxanthomonas sp. UTMC 1351 TaxID=2695853 RepID=UPI0034CEF585